MYVIPAIDLKDGRCVRLKQGRMNRETIYSDAPEEMALKWFEKGAERLHIVDLDGAVGGKPVNEKAIDKIVKAAPIPIQLGGGIRDLKTIESYSELGIYQVILGTVAYKDPALVQAACQRYPGRIILGIDAKSEHVAIEGWTEETDINPVEMAKKFETDGISAIIYTDIQRDGMSTGPNLEATRRLAEAISIPVIASGGISNIHDIENILTLSHYGVKGMITGRALYEGTLDLEEAIKFIKKMN